MTEATRRRSRARPRQAGRNLPAAIAVGVALALLLLGSLLVRKEAFLVVLIVAVWIGVWETARAVQQAGIQVPFIPIIIGSASMITAAFSRGPEALLLTFGLTCVGIVMWRVADGLDGAVADIAGAFFVALYPCLLAAFAALMLAADDGPLRVVFYLLVTTFSDIGGYAVGALFGRSPMAPSLSPKKSWEGLAGSVLACAGVGAVSIALLFEATWWKGALIGVLVALSATIGDLIESSIKRDLGVKDMGSLLPGHGGIMDRLDSLLICVPIVWIALTWAVP